MLDTVDHCVACVNQLDLQQEFEDSLSQELPLESSSAGVQLHDLVLEQLCSGASPVEIEKRDETADESIEVTADQLEAFTCCDVCEMSNPIASLPCCTQRSICTGCLSAVSFPASAASRATRCLFCRTWILLSDSQIQILSSSEERCDSCDAVGKPMIPMEGQSKACDGCFMGQRYPLSYECRSCSAQQIISRPLYRSQESEGSFGKELFPCETCGKDSNWRLVPNQSFLPTVDLPWSSSSTILAEARQRVLAHAMHKQQPSETCTIQ